MNNDDNDDLDDIGNLNINLEVDKKDNPLKYVVNSKKKDLQKNSINNNSNKNEKTKEKKKKNSIRKGITYDDIYLGNDMFFSAPKSYPRDYEKNHKYQLSFTKSISKKNFSNETHKFDDNNISKNNGININLSVSPSPNSNIINSINNIGEEEENDEDDFGLLRYNSFEFYGKNEFSHLRDFLMSINNHRKKYDLFIDKNDINFVDEDEIKNKNIFYIENETELSNLNYYNKKNIFIFNFIFIYKIFIIFINE